jgi:hypothetical protein
MTCIRAGVQWSALALASIAVAACDPCAGTSACRTSDRVSYIGHTVERTTGKSVNGTEVMFVRTSGIELANDTIRAVSAGDGFFALGADARSAGLVTGTLHVSPPGRMAYDIPGIKMQTSRTAGDGGDLGRIVVDPYVMFIGQLRNRRTGADTAALAMVSFQRTGGIPIEPDRIETQADEHGRFFLAPVAKEPGTVTGLLLVRADGNLQVDTIPLSIETRFIDEAVHDVAVVNMGHALLWVGELYRRGTNEHQAGIQVDFKRTGGINADPAQFTTYTNDIGYFPIQPRPLGDGELVGSITVHPPVGSPFTVPNIRIGTTPGDTVRFLGRFGYGPHAYGLLELRYRTTQSAVAPGTVVTFRRISGVETSSPTYTDVVREHGFSSVDLGTNVVGTVLADVEVKLGEPWGTDTLRNVPIRSTESDTLPFVGTYIAGRWFPVIAQVLDSATHKPIAGATVTFTRIDGIDIKPNPYTVTPDAEGLFPLRPQPLTDGEVVGNLTFNLPAPYPSTVTIPGIHIHSSMSDALTFLGLWFVGPQK